MSPTIAAVQLRIWDFSGQTALFFINDKTKFPKDCQQQSDQEVSVFYFIF